MGELLKLSNLAICKLPVSASAHFHLLWTQTIPTIQLLLRDIYKICIHYGENAQYIKVPNFLDYKANMVNSSETYFIVYIFNPSVAKLKKSPRWLSGVPFVPQNIIKWVLFISHSHMWCFKSHVWAAKIV